jgi:hypothetical protein
MSLSNAHPSRESFLPPVACYKNSCELPNMIRNYGQLGVCIDVKFNDKFCCPMFLAF